MKARVALGTALILLVVAAFALDAALETDAGFSALVLLLCLAAWWEYGGIALGGEGIGLHVAGGIAVAAMLGAVWLDHHPHGAWPSDADAVLLPGLLVACLGGLLLGGALGRDPARAFARGAAAFTGVVWVGYLAGFALRLRYAGGGFWIALLIASVKGNDSAAYFIGKTLGRRPLTPVSPRKSVEGAAAGLVAGTVIFAAGALAARGRAFSWPGAIASGMIIGVAAQAGDLAESLAKRAANVKDSGRGFPGLGGFLDVLDSLLFACPVGYFLIRWAP